jgi:uncharacterized membrane protein
MMLIIRQHRKTPMLPVSCISALLCALLVWPFATPLNIVAIDLLKLFLLAQLSLAWASYC